MKVRIKMGYRDATPEERMQLAHDDAWYDLDDGKLRNEVLAVLGSARVEVNYPVALERLRTVSEGTQRWFAKRGIREGLNKSIDRPAESRIGERR